MAAVIVLPIDSRVSERSLPYSPKEARPVYSAGGGEMLLGVKKESVFCTLSPRRATAWARLSAPATCTGTRIESCGTVKLVFGGTTERLMSSA